MNSEAFETIKVWVKSKRLLRKIAAETGESMSEAFNRLVTEEAKRLKFIQDSLEKK